MGVYAVLRTAATVYVLEEPLTSIGRDESCDLQLAGRGVSRVHAEITFSSNGADPKLKDLGSQNGTFVNGERLRAKEPQLLRHGDHVHFSAFEKTSFRFELPGHEQDGVFGQALAAPSPPTKTLPIPRSNSRASAAAREDVEKLPAAGQADHRGRTAVGSSGAGKRAESVGASMSRARPPNAAGKQGTTRERSGSSDAAAHAVRASSSQDGKAARAPWRPRGGADSAGDAVAERGRMGNAAPADAAKMLSAMNRAVGHLDDLFAQLQEAGEGLEDSILDQGSSPGHRSTSQGQVAMPTTEQLRALVQRAEKLAAIHVPKEVKRLREAAACAARERRRCSSSRQEQDTTAEMSSTLPADTSNVSGKVSAEASNLDLGSSEVHADAHAERSQPRQARRVNAVLRTADMVYVLEEPLTSIGRDEACDLQLRGRGVSRFHAEIAFGPEGSDATIRDLGSSNGTFVNGERLRAREAQQLQHGDQVIFSAYEKTSYRFELPGCQQLGRQGSCSSLPPAKMSLILGSSNMAEADELREVSACAPSGGLSLSQNRRSSALLKADADETSMPPNGSANENSRQTWHPRSSQHSMPGVPQGADLTPRGAANGGTPDFGGPQGDSSPGDSAEALRDLQADSASALPTVRRAVERLEDLFSRLREAGEHADAVEETFPGPDLGENSSTEATLGRRGAANEAVGPPEAAPAAEELAELMQRAERLAAIQVPREVHRMQRAARQAAARSAAEQRAEAPKAERVDVGASAEVVNDACQAACQESVADMGDRHVASKGSKRSSKPSVQLHASNEPAELEAEIAKLRQQLSEFAATVPAAAAASSSASLQEVKECQIIAELEKWRDIVSSKDMLNRSESSAVLGLLLGAERALAELRRSETAASRRWTALTEEGRAAKEKLRALRAGVHKLRQRGAEVSVAASGQRQKLWTELEAEVSQHGDQLQSLAVQRVKEELEVLDASVRELQSGIATHVDEEMRWSGKQLQADRRCKLLERIGAEASASAAEEGDASIEQVSVDQIISLETENELLQWQLYHAEEQARAVENQCHTAAVGSSEEPDKQTFITAVEFGPTPKKLSSQGPPMHAPPESITDDCATGISKPSPEAEATTEVCEFELAGHGHDGSATASEELRSRPEIANLCERLALPRDARREFDRTRRKRSVTPPDAPPVVETQETHVGGNAVSRGQNSDAGSVKSDDSLEVLPNTMSNQGQRLGPDSESLAAELKHPSCSSKDPGPEYRPEWRPILPGSWTRAPRAPSAEAAALAQRGPSDFWDASPSCDTLGLADCRFSDQLLSGMIPSGGAAPSCSDVKANAVDSLDKLCEDYPRALVSDDLGTRLPVRGMLPMEAALRAGSPVNSRPPWVPGTGISGGAPVSATTGPPRTASGASRASPAAAAGALAMGRPPCGAYPSGSSSSTSWKRPAAYPAGSTAGASPSDAWASSTSSQAQPSVVKSGSHVAIGAEQNRGAAVRSVTLDWEDD